LLSFQIAELLRISALEIDVLLARSTLYFGFWSCTYQHFCQKKRERKKQSSAPASRGEVTDSAAQESENRKHSGAVS
jgi:hypothetical protein